jgi:pteridine reductase
LAHQGYSIVLHYRTAREEAAEAVASYKSHGIDAIALQAELTEEEQVRDLVRQILETKGRLDVLVNCTAAWEGKPLEEVTPADVRFHFESNTLAQFTCAQHAGLAMVKQEEGGCIVNTGDWAEARPHLDFAAYFASKGAVGTMTRSLAVELGTRNPRVRVNCVLAGPVISPGLSDEERRAVINAALVKREGCPHHVAQAVLSLIDNDFVTGVCMPVEGGRTIYAPQ